MGEGDFEIVQGSSASSRRLLDRRRVLNPAGDFPALFLDPLSERLRSYQQKAFHAESERIRQSDEPRFPVVQGVFQTYMLPDHWAADLSFMTSDIDAMEPRAFRFLSAWIQLPRGEAGEDNFRRPLFTIEFEPTGRWKNIQYYFPQDVTQYFLDQLVSQDPLFREVRTALGFSSLSQRAHEEVFKKLSFLRRSIAPEALRFSPKRTHVRSVHERPASEETLIVAPGQYVFSRGDDPRYKRYIETDNVESCVAVTMYDPSAKIGGLTHLHVANDVQSALSLLYHGIQLAASHTDQQAPLDVRLVGGIDHPRSRQLLFDVYQYLQTLNVRILEEDVIRSSLDHMPAFVPEKNLLFDLHDGTLYNVPHDEAGPMSLPGHHPHIPTEPDDPGRLRIW